MLQWVQQSNSIECDGFEVTRLVPTGRVANAQIILHVDHVPPRFKLEPQLAAVLGVYSDTRANIVSAFWEYVKVTVSAFGHLLEVAHFFLTFSKAKKLQDPVDREFIVPDAYLKEV